MASLADELNLDPAFDDANFGSTSLSFDEEQGGNSSVEISPIRNNGRRGKRRAAQSRGVRNSYSSEEQDQQEHHTLEGLGEGFSLADELGNGNAQPATTNSLAQEVNEYDELIIDSISSNSHLIDDETKSRRDREYYLDSSEVLNSSLQMTETFLSKLKQTSAIISATENVQGIPSSASNSSLCASGVHSDDTSTLEGRAGQIVKQMRDHSNTREDQIRELQECDRVLRRALEEGGDWISALANVDELENDLSLDGIEEEDALAYISNRKSSKYTAVRRSISLTQNDVMLEEEEEESHRSADSSASFIRLPLSSLALNDQQMPRTANQKTEYLDTSRATICQELLSLQHSTKDLVTSLGSIHEQSQVARASMNEAARRIKTIKTVFHNWNAEIEAAEQSQAHITWWEAAGIESGARPKDIHEWTDNHIEKFQRILNDASIKAAELLSPVQDDVLDGIVAGKG